MTKKIGILGGTFDPIHNGHLRAAIELQQILDLAEVRFIPCQIPVHKDEVHANAKQRVEMLKLATQEQPGFNVDPREVNRDTPSYTIETLQSLRQEFPDEPLLLVIGTDAFKNLATWHEWEKFLDYCHIIVVLRPGYQLGLDENMEQYLLNHTLKDASELDEKTHGGIYIQSITALDISATMIRSQLSVGLSPRFLLPEAVLAYISEQKLYS